MITGSAKGIGAATAKLLGEHGAAVVVNYRGRVKEAQEIADSIQQKKGKAVAIQADVTQLPDIQKLVNETMNHFGKIDIWINNVSDYTGPKMVTEVEWGDYIKEFEGAVKSTLLCCQTVIPIMQKQKYGRIINLVSTLVTRPVGGYSAHATAKSALMGFTKTLAKEVGKHGITVNMVSPGMTLTEEVLKTPEKARNTIAEKTPLKRLATPEDIAVAILFFASDLSSFITGAYLPIDGGLSLPIP